MCQKKKKKIAPIPIGAILEKHKSLKFLLIHILGKFACCIQCQSKQKSIILFTYKDMNKKNLKKKMEKKMMGRDRTFFKKIDLITGVSNIYNR